MRDQIAEHHGIETSTATLNREGWKTILLATDGSEDAHAALRVAADLAQRAGATLHLVTAYDLPAIALYAFPTTVGPQGRSPFETEAFALLETERTRASKLGAEVSDVHAGMGVIDDVIVRVAEDIDADLIVVGRRELSGLKRLLGESTSAGVMHGACCPVLIVRGGIGSWPPNDVVVGFDYSPESEGAAHAAASVSRMYPGTALTLVQVLEDSAVHPNRVLRTPEGVDVEHRRLDLQAAPLENLAGHAVETVIAVGDPATVLIERADRPSTTKLVVIGTRGLGNVRRLVLGSVSTKVLHSGHSPLLVIPERAIPGAE
jgi:nucleotide-binding universal stress UspA family protein